MSVLSTKNLITPGQRTLKDAVGTAWARSSSLDTIGSILEYEWQTYSQHTQRFSQTLSRPAIDRLAKTVYVAQQVLPYASSTIRATTNGQYIVRLPADVTHVCSLQIGTLVLDYGADFTIEDNLLILRVKQVPDTDHLIFKGLSVLLNSTLDFWSHPLGYREHSPHSLRFLKALHYCHQQAASWYGLCELLAAAVEVPCVSSPGQVVDILERPGFPAIVVTTTEMLVGSPGDLPTVRLKQQVAPGDFVFDSLRFHSFQDPLPIWLNQLTVGPNYFDIQAKIVRPLTITTTPATPVTVQSTDNLVHLQLPWSGDLSDQTRLYNRSKEREREVGNTLAESLAPGRSEAEWATTELNWLEALWSTWLRHGASVSLLKDKPSAAVLSRLAQVRRVIPPWTTHFIQFLQPPDAHHHDLC